MTLIHSITYFNQETETLEEWPYIFLHATRYPLPEEEIDKLMWNAVDMASLGESSRRVKSDGYHADLARGEAVFIGHFYGLSISAKLDMGSDKTDDLGVVLLKK